LNLEVEEVEHGIRAALAAFLIFPVFESRVGRDLVLAGHPVFELSMNSGGTGACARIVRG
ncbi:MAG: hypothetical protein P8M79_01360, partial [Alphaproteobacteria bacterium]|nr:hypothetical protein [Alphaproteobacteria bacterium]